MSIQSFADKDTEGFFITGQTKNRARWANIIQIARRKLDILHYAAESADLEAPPGNRLKALKGDMKGLYSIRINDQWRIVFRWTDAGPFEVRITDYH